MVLATASGSAQCPKCGNLIPLGGGGSFTSSGPAPTPRSFVPTAPSYSQGGYSPQAPAKPSSGSKMPLIIIAVVLLLCCVPTGLIGGGIWLVMLTVDSDDGLSTRRANSAASYGDPYSQVTPTSDMGQRTLAAWQHMRRIDSQAEVLLDEEDGALLYWQRLQRDYGAIQTTNTDPEFVALMAQWKSVADNYVRYLKRPALLQSDAEFDRVDAERERVMEIEDNLSRTLSKRYQLDFESIEDFEDGF